jgi:hypothetical protein
MNFQFFFVLCLNDIPKYIYLSPMVIMEELCVRTLGLVAAIAGKLTLSMRFELWCFTSLVHWRAVRKHFMLWWGKCFRTACCVIIIEAPKHRNSLHVATEHVGCLSYVRLEVLTVVGVRDVCLLGCDAAYFRKEEAAAVVVSQDWLFQDGGSKFLRHAHTRLPNSKVLRPIIQY